MIYKSFDKNSVSLTDKSAKVAVLIMKLNKMSNQLKNYTNQLLKNILRKRVYSSSKDNILGPDLADM